MDNILQMKNRRTEVVYVFVDFKFNLFGALPNTLAGLSLSRPDSTIPDTFGNNIVISFIQAFGIKWHV